MVKLTEEELLKYFRPDLNQARRRTFEKTESTVFLLDPDLKTFGHLKKFMVSTHGCQSNEVDSEVISGILENMSFTKAQSIDETDVYIINTCAIRETAETKAWSELGRIIKFKRHNPDLIIGMCGCMTQEPKTIERILKKVPELDIVFGTHNIYRLPEYIKTAVLSKERVVEVYSIQGEIVENLPQTHKFAHKAFVNIMYGCDEFCTFCIVPYTRGKERSREPIEIISEVQALADRGYMEVTLLGQNVNSYGRDFKDRTYTFGHLLFDLAKTKIPRIRFMTSYPRDIDEICIKAITELKQVMPYLHLPVQSGSNLVLRRMNRHYTKELYLEKINAIKALRPEVTVTTDIIVAFPGETESDFQDTLDLVKAVGYDGAFTFIFSPREGTPASKFKDYTPLEVKKERLARLNKLTSYYAKQSSLRYVGKVLDVLVDGYSRSNNAILSGYSAENKLVNFVGSSDKIGKIVKVKITKANSYHLFGEEV